MWTLIWKTEKNSVPYKTRRMAIAKGTCVSFCNQPKAHFGIPWVCPLDNCCITRMERGFSAGQMHRSIYPSIFNRLWAIVRYWSEIATFSYPLAFNVPVGVFLLQFLEKVCAQKTRIMGLPASDDSLTIGWAVSSLPACDRQTSSLLLWLAHIKNYDLCIGLEIWKITFLEFFILQIFANHLVVLTVELMDRIRRQ